LNLRPIDYESTDPTNAFMSAFGASPGYDYLSRVTAGYSGIASTAPDIKVARKTSSFPSIVTCAVPSGPTPNS